MNYFTLDNNSPYYVDKNDRLITTRHDLIVRLVNGFNKK